MTRSSCMWLCAPRDVTHEGTRVSGSLHSVYARDDEPAFEIVAKTNRGSAGKTKCGRDLLTCGHSSAGGHPNGDDAIHHIRQEKETSCETSRGEETGSAAGSGSSEGDVVGEDGGRGGAAEGPRLRASLGGVPREAAGGAGAAGKRRDAVQVRRRIPAGGAAAVAVWVGQAEREA